MAICFGGSQIPKEISRFSAGADMRPQFQSAWDSRTGVNMLRIAAVLLVSLCLFAAPTATFGQTPARLELSQDWKLAAAKEVSTDGVALSQPAYDDHKWLPIHRMPATILEILQEDWRLSGPLFREESARESAAGP